MSFVSKMAPQSMVKSANVGYRFEIVNAKTATADAKYGCKKMSLYS
ncbi:hypothetical protein [Thalassotalea litorea]|nr:hypothetical protein [Thalassotalea litorea]